MKSKSASFLRPGKLANEAHMRLLEIKNLRHIRYHNIMYYNILEYTGIFYLIAGTRSANP